MAVILTAICVVSLLIVLVLTDQTVENARQEHWNSTASRRKASMHYSPQIRKCLSTTCAFRSTC